MKPIYIYGMVLLMAVLGCAAAGAVLMRVKWLRARHVTGYTRIATLLILAAAYAMAQYDWPGVHLRQLDLWSLLVILAILAYSLIRVALVYALPYDHGDDFKKSFMLSMLYTDSEHMAASELRALDKKSAKP